MAENISVYSTKCSKDVPVLNNEVFKLSGLDEADNLQEIVNRYLQYNFDEKFSTCHNLITKRMKISNIKP